ncbi:SUMF1/EgtB/PvdO family nonheme iron enzyme [Marinoscillum furvescens]|uniref:Putative secreted protein (Por secretion system target) n=1 Tax=Marinoscillum furvescens DSM 4134 TaxID=1122208 RepID=A0A3D9KWG1_MARFU|nr:SUMF1/EgtB/PvdO family nonheme iron enzyme [Marinoscillum furvescens]RED92067.1 putative secreted protein (Por secretion system target) [Marinoscillum furvescens DSM 4134]
MKSPLFGVLFALLFSNTVFAQSLPSGIVMKEITGGTFTMGSNNLTGSPDQQAAAPEHEVTVSAYTLSEAEITNAQYVEFLNAAYADGLVEVTTGTAGPDKDKQLITGTSSSSYSGKVLYTLDGTRVMKDHDNDDGDNNPFTGVIEPENPLNIAYIGFDSSSKKFYVKDPHDAGDFHWKNLCDYYDYGTKQGSFESTLKNDFEDWSGAGLKLSTELEGWTEANPSAAKNLPTKAEVSDWPVTFIRWWGAKAFAIYYDLDLPTEAQWEFAAKGGKDFKYAVHDGADVADANWNQEKLKVATHHVRAAVSGTANPFGLYNLAGNAWEWIADNYVAPYATSAATDPNIQVSGSTLRCWRGGSWNYHEATLQSAMRFSDEEDRGNDHFGFRIAGSVEAEVILEGAQGKLYLYPNPASDRVHINLPNQEVVSIELYSISGRWIRSIPVGGGNVIDVSDLDKGYYLLRVGSQTHRLIIQ